MLSPPTCTRKGYTTYTCSRCGDSYVGDYADATGHDYAGVATAPTCTEKGYTTYTCSRCGDSYKEDIDATGHNWGEAQYVWSDENTRVTATRVCLNDASHIETETAIASLTAVEEAKDGLSGSETYSATFNNAAFEQQTKKVWSQICDSEALPGNDQYYDPAAAEATAEAAAEAAAEASAGKAAAAAAAAAAEAAAAKAAGAAAAAAAAGAVPIMRATTVYREELLREPQAPQWQPSEALQGQQPEASRPLSLDALRPLPP